MSNHEMLTCGHNRTSDWYLVANQNRYWGRICGDCLSTAPVYWFRRCEKERDGFDSTGRPLSFYLPEENYITVWDWSKPLDVIRFRFRCHLARAKYRLKAFLEWDEQKSRVSSEID
ncbi:MAG: hypothetical protein HQL31_11200 [Planctomycetes bacterium]|nr:hypothetical protein [Planctomycetota bacterium]